MDSDRDYPPLYLSGIEEFNRHAYFESHEVWEGLWRDAEGVRKQFYKGLIQLAGGFVHLQKQRLGPAARLFGLALTNFEPYAAYHDGIDLNAIRDLCRNHRQAIIDSGETLNPWTSRAAPQLALPRAEFC